MFITFFQTYVNNNVCCCGSRDVLLSNARTNMMHVTEREREKWKKQNKESREYPNEKTSDQQW